MLDRTLISLAGGFIAFFVVLVGAWLVVTAFGVIGWQVPFAAGVAVAVALWFIDFLSEQMSKRQG